MLPNLPIVSQLAPRCCHVRAKQVHVSCFKAGITDEQAAGCRFAVQERGEEVLYAAEEYLSSNEWDQNHRQDILQQAAAHCEYCQDWMAGDGCMQVLQQGARALPAAARPLLLWQHHQPTAVASALPG